ncbi:lipase maturation factor 1, partial [Chelydra serpentina]
GIQCLWDSHALFIKLNRNGCVVYYWREGDVNAFLPDAQIHLHHARLEICPVMVCNDIFIFVFFLLVVAFLVAYHQNKQLIGEKGLLPGKLYLQNVQRYFKGKINLDTLSYAPTIIWFLDWSAMDSILDYLAGLGLGISACVLVTGCANMILMAILWILYLSLVNVGQICLQISDAVD